MFTVDVHRGGFLSRREVEMDLRQFRGVKGRLC